MKKKIILIVILIAGCNPVFSEANDNFRLKALKFFCQNKDELVKVSNYNLGKQEPLFLLDLSGYDDSLFLTSEWEPDTTILEFYLNEIIEKYIVINNKEIDVSPTFKISDFCDCIYQRIYSSDCYDYIDSNLCAREYSLNVSNVITYKESYYVVLQIISHFAGKFRAMQFIIMEFSNDGYILRCGKGILLVS